MKQLKHYPKIMNYINYIFIFYEFNLLTFFLLLNIKMIHQLIFEERVTPLWCLQSVKAIQLLKM